MNRQSLVWCLIACLIVPSSGLGAQSATRPARPTHEELVKMGLKASPEAMEWWRDAKFGIFIHWGVGIEKRHVPWANRTDQVYWDHLFANLKKVTKFNAKEWIDLVKAGGGKYVIFMTRQNGAMHRRPTGNLCLWDTNTTDNKLTHPNSPFKRDVCKEIADAAHKAGIELEWYHCGQVGESVRELLTNYGRVRGIWFDGGAPPKGKTAQDMYRMMRKLQPGIVTNGGLGGTKYGGDYDTPQHDVPWPGWNSRPVEVAAILRNGYWYWDLDRKGRPRSVKSLKQVVDLLMGCVGGGNNLALNLAPRPDGSFEPNEVQRIKEVGAWLKKHGRSVYGTRKGPYSPSEWGVCTRDKAGRTIYIHMLHDLNGGKLVLRPLNRRIVSAKLLTSPKAKVVVAQSKEKIEIAIPREHVDEIDTIIAFELDGPASGAKVVPPPVASLTTGRKASASHVFTWPGIGVTKEMNGPHNAVDGNFDTGWCSTGSGKKDRSKPRWLEVDLGEPAEVGRGLVGLSRALESHRKGVQAFAVQTWQGDKWVGLFDSKSLKGIARRRWDHRISFEPVTARRFRLLIWGRNTYVREFQLFPAAKQ